MIAPAVPRWIAAQLGHETRGINALAPLVPRDAADAAPPEVAIHNVADDAWVARSAPVEAVTPDLWILRVAASADAFLAGNPDGVGSLQDTMAVILMLEGLTGDARNDIAACHLSRLVRAIRKSLRLAFSEVRAQDLNDLTLDGLIITLPTSIPVQVQPPVAGSGEIAVALSLDFSINDSWALGA